MLDQSYIIAIALIEQGKKRVMPLGGKSLKEPINTNQSLAKIGNELINDLLIRVFQQSENGSLKRAAGDKSLLLLKIPMMVMQEKIPIIKANWINGGDTEELINQFCAISNKVWAATFTKGEGINFLNLS